MAFARIGNGLANQFGALFPRFTSQWEPMGGGIGVKTYSSQSTELQTTLCTALCDSEFDRLFYARKTKDPIPSDFTFVGEYRFSMYFEEAISIFSEDGVCKLTKFTKQQLYKKIQILHQEINTDPRGPYIHFVVLLNGFSGGKSDKHDPGGFGVYCSEEVKSHFDVNFQKNLLWCQLQRYPINRITYAFLTSTKPKRMDLQYVHFLRLSTQYQKKYGYEEMKIDLSSNPPNRIQCISVCKEWRILHKTKMRIDGKWAGTWIAYFYKPRGNKKYLKYDWEQDTQLQGKIGWRNINSGYVDHHKRYHK
jgi:hypothetical protein